MNTEFLSDFFFFLSHLTGLVSERILARDPLDEIKRAFQLFDDDNTGKISLRNLRRVARDLGDKLDDEELYVVFSQICLRTRVPYLPIDDFLSDKL